MSETDLQLGGGYTYQWECAILLALNYFFEPVRYNPTLFDLVNDFLGQVAEIHLEGEDRESGVDLEDITLVNGDRRILIQVKTKQAEGERWTPTDPLFLKALYRFYDSRFFAEQPADTRFVFLTNRPFNRTLARIKSAISKGTLAQCAEADKLCQHLDRYARKEKGEPIDADLFREMLARTALVEYLAVDEVKANVQAKLQAHGRHDWEQAHALLFGHFARQSTRVGGGMVARASVIEVLGQPEAAPPPSLAITVLPPPPPDYFVDRREILNELKAGLITGSTQAIIALQGMGGIGKTALAQQLALEIAADFPGGVFWADLSLRDGDPSPVLAAWATMCGHDVASLADPQMRAQAVRGMLGARLRAKGRLLVVLDDVRADWLQGAQTLRAALPPGVPLVITTRDEDLAYALGAKVRRLDALPMDDALDLLSRLAGAEVVEAELLEARTLAEWVERLPLALELAGKLAARYARKPGWRLATLRAQVEAKAVEALKLRGHPGLAVTFAISYEALKEEQQRLFRWLGVFASGPITVSATAGVLGEEEETTEVALDELVRLALVEWGKTEGVYRLPPLLAEYARTLLKEANEEKAAREAHLTYYLAYAEANAKIDPAAHDRLEAELANLMAAAAWAAQARKRQAVGDLGTALYTNSGFLDVRGYYKEAVQLLTWSLTAAREIGDQRGAGLYLSSLGLAYANLGDAQRAIGFYEQALAIAHDIGDRHGEGNALGRLGDAYQILGDIHRAIQFHEQHLNIALEIGDRRGESSALGSLGNAYRNLGQVERAIEYYQRALEIAHEIGDWRNQGTWLGNLGLAYAVLGQVERASEYHQQALEIAREIGDRWGEGAWLGNLGNAYRDLGQVERAILYYQQALEIARQIGDLRSEGIWLDNLGLAYAVLGQVKQASGYHQQALDISREIGNRSEEGKVLSNLANVYAELRETQQAIACYEQALVISRETGNRRTEQQILNNLGAAYNTLGQADPAMTYYQQALTIARQNKDLPKVAEILLSLGSLARDNEQFDEAGRFWEESRNIYRELKHPYESTVLSLLYELESTQSLISLVEIAQRFFHAAGFELIPSEEETSFLCQPRARVWKDKFSQPIPVRIVSGIPLDADTVYALCQSAHKALDHKPTAVFVVIDHTPTDSGWLQISTMRAEDVQVIPIDDAVLFEGQGRGRQRQVLEKHLRRFLGREQDFYNVRHPVADRLNFFGREALANELIEHLIEGRPLALLGLRKMGKSSLLMYLRDKLPFPTALVDLQAGVELGDLYERILTSWSRSMRVKVGDLGWSPPDLIGASDLSSTFAATTRQLLTLLEDHDVSSRLCLLVDETEWIVPHHGEGVGRYLAFARALRGLVQEEEGRFLLLMAGVDPLFNRVNRLAGQQNPFYQFFREVYLPSLERDDCIQMIRNIGQQMDLIYGDKAVAFVADVSGGHPFLARQLCSLAFQQLGRSGDVPLSHLQETARRFIREPGTSELVDENGLWGEISSPDLWPQPQVVENQTILKSLAQTEPQPESDLMGRAQDRRACERSLDELERRSVLGEPERSLFNIHLRLFRSWIRRYQLGEEA